jgi:hypothetical protein
VKKQIPSIKHPVKTAQHLLATLAAVIVLAFFSVSLTSCESRDKAGQSKTETFEETLAKAAQSETDTDEITRGKAEQSETETFEETPAKAEQDEADTVKKTQREMDDDLRMKLIEEINQSDGIEYIFGSRRPIKLENGIHYHGWIYNKEIDIATIQFTYGGKIINSHKDKMAVEILKKWNGDVGDKFRKSGFKDIAIMITEFTITKVYSSKYDNWYDVEDYLKLNF